MQTEVKDMAKSVVELLQARSIYITFAESCTGGLLSSYLTSIPGSSKVFSGSMITYSNEIKHKLLGVDNEVFESYGAVSKQCAEQMLDGIRELGDVAVAVTGIAGPTGATAQKPVGTVYIGVLFQNHKIIKHMLFRGDRDSVREQSVLEALKMVEEIIS